MEGDANAREELKLNSDQEPALPYSRRLEDYQAQYSTDVRNIKKWIARGRSAEAGADLPPLDDPDKMIAWWERHMAHRVPAKLLEAKAAAGPCREATRARKRRDSRAHARR